jgi:hypothetical protein
MEGLSFLLAGGELFELFFEFSRLGGEPCSDFVVVLGEESEEQNMLQFRFDFRD